MIGKYTFDVPSQASATSRKPESTLNQINGPKEDESKGFGKYLNEEVDKELCVVDQVRVDQENSDDSEEDESCEDGCESLENTGGVTSFLENLLTRDDSLPLFNKKFALPLTDDLKQAIAELKGKELTDVAPSTIAVESSGVSQLLSKMKDMAAALDEIIEKISVNEKIAPGQVQKFLGKLQSSLSRFVGGGAGEEVLAEVQKLLESPELQKLLNLIDHESAGSGALTQAGKPHLGNGAVPKVAVATVTVQAGAPGGPLAEFDEQEIVPEEQARIKDEAGVIEKLANSKATASPINKISSENLPGLNTATSSKQVSKLPLSDAADRLMEKEGELKLESSVLKKSSATLLSSKPEISEEAAKILKDAKVTMTEKGDAASKSTARYSLPGSTSGEQPGGQQNSSSEQRGEARNDELLGGKQSDVGLRVLKKMKQILKEHNVDGLSFETVQKQQMMNTSPVQKMHAGTNTLNQMMNRIQTLINSKPLVSGSMEFQSIDFGDMRLAAEIQGERISVEFSSMNQHMRSELLGLKQGIHDELKLLGFEDIDLNFDFGQEQQTKQSFEDELARKESEKVKLVGDQAGDIEEIREWLRSFEQKYA
ncbi:MAG: hypothetical protein HRT88_03520 [Lentisphaeraceae bacterium]|nr:hypothetical protein [Lentisphaeraceae bacterium]